MAGNKREMSHLLLIYDPLAVLVTYAGDGWLEPRQEGPGTELRKGRSESVPRLLECPHRDHLA